MLFKVSDCPISVRFEGNLYASMAINAHKSVEASACTGLGLIESALVQFGNYHST